MKTKKTIYRLISASLVLSTVLTCFTACSDKNNHEYHEEPSFGQYENHETVSDTTDVSVPEAKQLDVVCPTNEDGVLDIGHFGSWKNETGVYFEEDYDENNEILFNTARKKIFAYSYVYDLKGERKNLAQQIGVYDKNAVIGLYSDFDSLNLVKINSDVSYTYNMDFIYHGNSPYIEDYDISPYPGYVDVMRRGSAIDVSDSDPAEINGKDYYEYLTENTIRFTKYTAISYSYDGHIILPAEKGEALEIGSYYGTEWKVHTFIPEIQYFIFENSNAIPVNVTKTRNGYFTVDLSALEDGYYFVNELQTIIKVA